MEHGPVEVIVVEFPEGRFTGQIIPELVELVDAGTIAIIDGVFVRRELDGDLLVMELDGLNDVEAPDSVGDLLVGEPEDLLSDEDIRDLAAGIAPGGAAAMLAFEHRWAVGLRRSILAAGGRLVANIRIPGEVVDEVADIVAATGQD